VVWTARKNKSQEIKKGGRNLELGGGWTLSGGGGEQQGKKLAEKFTKKKRGPQSAIRNPHKRDGGGKIKRVREEKAVVWV